MKALSVPKEVADFLEQDRKREQAEERRDRRHLSKGTLETVPYCCGDVERPVEDEALGTSDLNVCREPWNAWTKRIRS